jgi:hypothetical protein
MWQIVVVALLVALAVLQSMRSLLPFAARVALARHAQGRLPDRWIVWFAGQGACDACGGRLNRPQRTK